MERDGKLAKGTQKMADGDGFGGKLLMNLTKEVPLQTLSVKVMFFYGVSGMGGGSVGVWKCIMGVFAGMYAQQ